MEIKEAADKQNPGETQDTSDVRTTQHSHQSDIEIQEDAEGTWRGDGSVARALMLALWTAAQTLHQPQEAGVEPLEGKDASNSAAERPYGVKERLYKNYSMVLGATLWHTLI